MSYLGVISLGCVTQLTYPGDGRQEGYFWYVNPPFDCFAPVRMLRTWEAENAHL